MKAVTRASGKKSLRILLILAVAILQIGFVCATAVLEEQLGEENLAQVEDSNEEAEESFSTDNNAMGSLLNLLAPEEEAPEEYESKESVRNIYSSKRHDVPLVDDETVSEKNVKSSIKSKNIFMITSLVLLRLSILAAALLTKYEFLSIAFTPYISTIFIDFLACVVPHPVFICFKIAAPILLFANFVIINGKASLMKVYLGFIFIFLLFNSVGVIYFVEKLHTLKISVLYKILLVVMQEIAILYNLSSGVANKINALGFRSVVSLAYLAFSVFLLYLSTSVFSYLSGDTDITKLFFAANVESLRLGLIVGTVYLVAKKGIIEKHPGYGIKPERKVTMFFIAANSVLILSTLFFPFKDNLMSIIIDQILSFVAAKFMEISKEFLTAPLSLFYGLRAMFENVRTAQPQFN